MQLRLTEEQEILRKSARNLLAARMPLEEVAARESNPEADDASFWKEMASLGWLSVNLPAELGGGDGSLADVELLCEELGRALCPSPFVPVAIAAAAALETIGTARANSLLAELACGASRPVLAVSNDLGRWDPSSRATTWDGSRLKGRKRYVDAAGLADHLIVTALDERDRTAIVLVEARGSDVTLVPLPSMAGVHLTEVRLDGAHGEVLCDGWGAIDAALTRSAVMHAAWCSGAAARLLEETVEYASERRQFGVPIGSFQAVQHRLADCDIAAAESETLARQAARLLDSNAKDARRMAAIAFVRATAGFVRLARSCHQVWGGMGFSTEMHVHLFSRRAKEAQHAWGGTGYHLDVVAEEMRSHPLLRDRYALALNRRGLSL